MSFPPTRFPEMIPSPTQAVENQIRAFRESVTEALCGLGECQRAFELSALRIEQALQAIGRESARQAPAGNGGAPGRRFGRKAYAGFWLATAILGAAAFGAGFLAALWR
jgi:hypothetical protein